MKRMNRFYTSLLLLGLALAPSAALAVEPVIDGTKTNNGVLVQTSASWTTLLSRQVTIPANSIFHCEVTCTSTVTVPVDNVDANHYRYAAFNSTTPATNDGCVRRFDTPQVENTDDSDKLVVTDTCFIASQAGTPTFYCLGRKVNAVDLDVNITDTSMHVICIDKQG